MAKYLKSTYFYMQIQEYIYYAITIHAFVFTSLRMSVLTHSRSSYSLVASLDAAENCQPLNITHFFILCSTALLIYLFLYSCTLKQKHDSCIFPLYTPTSRWSQGHFQRFTFLPSATLLHLYGRCGP